MATETEICSDVPRRGKEKKGKAALAGALSGQEAVEESKPVRAAEQDAPVEASSVCAGGLVEVKVVRIPANPRVVVCEIQESGSRVLVRVPKTNAFFRKGMTFAAEPASSEGEPWFYSGKPPRFPGRW
jgi:hypothetical protein